MIHICMYDPAHGHKTIWGNSAVSPRNCLKPTFVKRKREKSVICGKSYSRNFSVALKRFGDRPTPRLLWLSRQLALTTLPRLKAMAFKGVVFVSFLCFFGPISATYCTFRSDCNGYFEKCCSDGVCRERCFSCSHDAQCGTGECCNSNRDCKANCYRVGGTIAGAIVGSLAFVSFIASIVCCYYCACCPYHRYRSRQTVVATIQPAIVSTATTRQVIRFQHPVPAGYNPTLTGGYNQPPPPYTAACLPPQAVAQAVPVNASQTAKLSNGQAVFNE